MNTSGKELAAEALQKLCAECPRGGSCMPEAHSLGAYVHILLDGKLTCMSDQGVQTIRDSGVTIVLSDAQWKFNVAFRRARFKLIAPGVAGA